MTIFSRETMNYRDAGETNYVIFTLPRLIVGSLGGLAILLILHSLVIIYRGDWTSKKMWGLEVNKKQD